MLMNSFQATLFYRMEVHFASSVEKGLKELLEFKHLYQNVRIESPAESVVRQQVQEMRVGSTIPGNRELIDETIRLISSSFSKVEWEIINPGERKSLPFNSPAAVMHVSLRFTPPSVKLYCGNCKRKEAYNFRMGQDLLKEFRGELTEEVNEQIFSLAYQCQSCKNTPEIFVVKRDNLRLVQSGRTPMEIIETPSNLPKKSKKYFSDAVIAYNSGQTLAGNFLLRTFIEQHVRHHSSNPNSQDVDELFSEYSNDLPDDFKQRFPSLKSLYDKLSDDMHGAIASEAVFLQSKQDIEKHFSAKALFALVDKED